MAEKNHFIYVGDSVTDVNRKPGDLSRTGDVINIHHGIWSNMFDRSYIIVGMEVPTGKNTEGYTEAHLRTLNLCARNPNNVKLFRSGKLFYLDDLVEFNGNEDEMGIFERVSKGQKGFVTEITTFNERLCYCIIDQQMYNKIKELTLKAANENMAEFERVLSDDDTYSKFKKRVSEENPELYKDMEQHDRLRWVYEDITRGRVAKEMESLPSRIEQRDEIARLDKASKFCAYGTSLKMIEVSPSNKKFEL